MAAWLFWRSRWRLLLLIAALPVAPGCGERPAAHRVERQSGAVSPQPPDADARVRPPRAIATH
jgi:hypothetical protein